MPPFVLDVNSKQPLSAVENNNNAKEAKVFTLPSVSSSTSSTTSTATAAFLNRRRNSILVALFALALVAVFLASCESSGNTSNAARTHEASGRPLRRSSLGTASVSSSSSVLSSSSSPPSHSQRQRRRPPPSAEASAIATALSSSSSGEELKTDAAYPLATLRSPLLTPAELLTLQHYARGASAYVEWGSGASTVLAAPMARRAVSIENQVSWFGFFSRESRFFLQNRRAAVSFSSFSRSSSFSHFPTSLFCLKTLSHSFSSCPFLIISLSCFSRFLALARSISSSSPSPPIFPSVNLLPLPSLPQNSTPLPSSPPSTCFRSPHYPKIQP